MRITIQKDDKDPSLEDNCELMICVSVDHLGVKQRTLSDDSLNGSRFSEAYSHAVWTMMHLAGHHFATNDKIRARINEVITILEEELNDD